MKAFPMIRLASSSPRRKVLLESLDLKFTVNPIIYTETYPETLTEQSILQFIVRNKLDAAISQITMPGIILCADTLVFTGEKILGKPDSLASANATLRALSGGSHKVITAVGLTDGEKEKLFYCESLVVFNKIPQRDIDYYIEKYQPLDKAGSYGIQEWIGHAYISRIEGSYNNIMGLPTHRLFSELSHW